MIYSISPFFNEFDLLDLKIAEEKDHVDKILIIEADQTFQANEKPLLLRDNAKYANMNKLQLCFLEGRLNPNQPDKFMNASIQKNSFAEFLDFNDDDVLLMCDLDEINNGEDIEKIVKSAREYEIVRLQEIMYYYKINLRRNSKHGWNAPFACTGRAMRKLNNDVHYVRASRRHNNIGKPILTNGRHFSFLMSPEEIAYKIHNFSHTEFMNNRFTNLENINRRIQNQIDPFDRKTRDGDIMQLEKCEIDDTYPKTILDNMSQWQKYIA